MMDTQGEMATEKKEARDVDEKQEMLDAIDTVKEIIAVPEDGIPQAMLDDAVAIAVVPDVIKASFLAGARHGDGVMVVRNAAGHWSPPVFIELTGGSVGMQAGVQSTDVVLVFKNRDAAQKVLNGEFTLGVDGSVAAGPVGREASAGTGVKLDHEIYSYSRSRGLFAGVSVDGSKITVSMTANAEYYGKEYATAHALVNGKGVRMPAEAEEFVTELSKHTAKKS
jgi:lipid-binding SYLF domain-containing protein